MKGHTTQKGKTWYAVVYEGRGPDGKHKHRWYSRPAPGQAAFRTERAARLWLNETLVAKQQGAFVVPNKETTAAFLRAWVSMPQEIKPSTLASYRMNVESHIIPAIGEVPLQQLTAMQIGGFYSALLDHGRKDGRGGLSGQTVKYIAMILKRALSKAVDLDLLVKNPAAKVATPRSSNGREMRTWAPNELRGFLERIADDPLHPALLTAATTGMRRGELLGLRWRDLDLNAATLSIQQTLLSVRYKLSFSSPKSKRSRRSISLDPVTIATLRKHRIRQLELRMQFGPDYDADKDLVFAWIDGTPYHPDKFSARFDVLVKASGLPRVRLHDLRHTAASIMLAAGVPAKVASERLGHSTTAITLDLYSHVTPALQADAASKVAAAVFGE